jgi:hypothetical protein
LYHIHQDKVNGAEKMEASIYWTAAEAGKQLAIFA